VYRNGGKVALKVSNGGSVVSCVSGEKEKREANRGDSEGEKLSLPLIFPLSSLLSEIASPLSAKYDLILRIARRVHRLLMF